LVALLWPASSFDTIINADDIVHPINVLAQGCGRDQTSIDHQVAGEAARSDHYAYRQPGSN
jgi:hypothetical protein